MRTLALLVLLAPVAAAQEVRSANGRFVARVRPPEIQVVETAEPHGRSLWTSRDLKLAPADEWRLSDDGKALVAIDAKGAAERPLVQVVREGQLLISADARALAVPAGLLGAWLPSDAPCIRLRSVERDGGQGLWLDLLARDDRVRSIDLETGALRLPRDEGTDAPLRVEPAAGEGTEPVFVSHWLAPEVCFAGEPLPVHDRGSLPTPAWKPAGFVLERDPASALRLVIVPRATPPPPGTIPIQVLKGFEESATVHGLDPGLYSIAVRGRVAEEAEPPRELRVLPTGTLVHLERPGGTRAEPESITLHDDGRIEARYERGAVRRVALAPAAVCEEIARLVLQLPAGGERRANPSPASGSRWEMDWSAQASMGGRPKRIVRDASSLEAAPRQIADLLLRAAPPSSAQPARYAIDLARSFLEVRTGSAGLLSAFGHDHRLMVRRFSGRVEADPGDLAHSSVELEVDAGSLAVVDDDSQGDRAAIEKEMNENVLEAGRNATIGFKSLAVRASAAAEGTYDLLIEGELALHGTSRKLRVPARLELRGERLRATGEISLLQSDFGIRPTSAVGGTVKVADKVRISFDVTAVKEVARGR
jgi:polyisoprenoid-binding protein YceI